MGLPSTALPDPVTIGAGEPVVLVHGTGADSRCWGEFAQRLVAAGKRVITYDRRGYGSTSDGPVRDYRVHVRDLRRLLAGLGEPVAVYGWSSGGNVALATAALEPEAITRVVVHEAPWHGLSAPTASMLAALAGVKYQQLRGRRSAAAGRFFTWASSDPDGSGFDRLPDEQRRELLDNARLVLAELDPHPFGVMMQHVRTARLASGVPVRWLVGAESNAGWYRMLAERAAAAAPLEVRVLPGLGHCAHIEHPEVFAGHVLDALAS